MLPAKTLNKPFQRFVFISGLLIFCAVITILLIRITTIRNNSDFKLSIIKIDVAIEDYRIDTAYSELKTAAESSMTVFEALQVIKRGFLLYQISEEDAIYEEILTKYTTRYPGNESIVGHATNFWVSQGNLTKALQFVDILKSKDWLPLKIEIFLRSGRVLPDEYEKAKLTNVNLPIAPNRYYEFNAFLEAFSLTQDSRYLLNAILLMTVQGQLDESISLLNNTSNIWSSRSFQENNVELYHSFTTLLVLLTRDTNNVNDAYLKIVEKTESDIARGIREDLAYLSGRFTELEMMFRDKDEDFSERDYHNLFLINQILSQLRTKPNSSRDPYLILSEGLEKYPGSYDLHRDLISYQMLHDKENARYIVNDLYAADPNPKNRLIKLLYDYDSLPKSSSIPLLWSLYLDSGKSDYVGRILAYLLWQIDDRVGLVKLLTQAIGREETPQYWISFYLGLLKIRNNDYVAAIGHWNDLPPKAEMYRLPQMRTFLAIGGPIGESFRFIESLGMPITVDEVEAGNSSSLRLEYYRLQCWSNIIKGNYIRAKEWFDFLYNENPGDKLIPRLRYWIEKVRISNDSN